ncbi:MAG: TIGR01777 family oxidoreductase [Cytophagales bacterium]|nr:TIGR01777 family oxidoreductase [Bernardetiaceae bacterium]MDW8204178.1 TIGR01777 family oxidoreductase [Cytophagales bacterium]
MQKVLITGGSGMIGRQLTDMLIAKGYQVCWLGRATGNSSPVRKFSWDISKGYIDPEALAETDYIIHLAGAGVADKPWTAARKQEILESRTHSTALLTRALRQLPHRVQAVIAASAIGLYGLDTGERLLAENAPAGQDFLARVVQAWEAETDLIAKIGIRVVKLRIGIVLSSKGGALPKLVQPVRLYAGAPLGSGKQWMSWIHVEDLCRMFIWAMENPLVIGAYNAVAPHPATNETVIKTVGKILKRPILPLHVPAFAIKLLFGEMGNMVLGGNKVSSQKVEQAGFTFRYPYLETALQHLLSAEATGATQ